MTRLLGVEFSPKTRIEIEQLPQTKPLGAIQVVTANPEMLMAAQKDQDLLRILQNSQHVVADGAGITWLCRFTGQKPPTRIPGVDLMQTWLLHANETRKSVVLVGGSAKAAQTLAQVVRQTYPRVRVEHVSEIQVNTSGESVETPKVLDVIQEIRPDFVFAAFGHGKQEKWIAQNLENFPNQCIAMGVGGAFDFIAGTVKRAPCWMRKFGLEWVYRLIQQPWRIGRILVAVPVFTVRALWFHITQKA